jgi:hypothetical protein
MTSGRSVKVQLQELKACVLLLLHYPLPIPFRQDDHLVSPVSVCDLPDTHASMNTAILLLSSSSLRRSVSKPHEQTMRTHFLLPDGDILHSCCPSTV